MVLSLIYQTIVIVLLLSFSFGPAFFALINTGIKHGYKTGAPLAVGVVLSDLLVCLLMIVLVDLGATNFIHDEKIQRFMGLMAGTILLVFGALYFRKPIKVQDASFEISAPSTYTMILKGFFLNSLNPAVWILWLGNVTTVGKPLNYSIFKMVVYFSFTLGLVLLVELSKVSAANKLKNILTGKTMQIINYITGALLVVFGLVMIYKYYFELA